MGSRILIGIYRRETPHDIIDVMIGRMLDEMAELTPLLRQIAHQHIVVEADIVSHDQARLTKEVQYPVCPFVSA